MSTLVNSAADRLTQSAIDVNSIGRVSAVDTWIGSRVRIKRTSRGISEQEFSTKLNIDVNDLAAFEAGEKRINANLLFRIAEFMDVRPGYFFRGYTGLTLERGQSLM
jgi:ribosome-binding protein aMBF1 (putative translation factor)